MRFFVAYLAAAVVFLGLDVVWLTQIGLSMYRRQLGALLLDTPNVVIAGAFYLIIVLGIVLLAVLPGLDADSWWKAIWLGAILGLVAYGTYDITNLSTLRGWSPLVTVVDIAWGTLLSAAASAVGYWAASTIGLK